MNNLTELSRTGNYALGDRTGRTITQTFIDGTPFQINGTVAHTAMIGSTAALFSKNRKAQIAGLIGWGLIGLAYCAGRKKTN